MTDRCSGLHCGGCGQHGGGGGARVIALVVAAVVAAAVLRAVWAALVGVLEIAAYVVLSLAAAAVTAGAVYAAVRIRAAVLARRDRRISPQVRAVITDVKAGRPVAVPDPVVRPALEAPRPQAGGWPLPGQWEQLRPRIGRDG
jgi:hypothetical protein